MGSEGSMLSMWDLKSMFQKWTSLTSPVSIPWFRCWLSRLATAVGDGVRARRVQRILLAERVFAMARPMPRVPPVMRACLVGAGGAEFGGWEGAADSGLEGRPGNLDTKGGKVEGEV